MATITAAARAAVARLSGVAQLRARRGERVRCGYSSRDGKEATPAAAAVKGATSMLAAAVAASSSSAPTAMALVDERMSTEGTGLSLGLSNNLLGWILLGVFGLIWSLYTIYTSTLDDDDESGGLSL
uniref:PSII 6.1 kDa protein n=1 Tax=Oryza glumipatula TaxID=40148 RepID=A0A0E0A1F1_9ORYZ